MKIVMLGFMALLSKVALGNDDTLSLYQSSLEKIAGSKITLYKYGNYKPRNIEEAFLVFLTGDSAKLHKFKQMELSDAKEYARNKENNLFRYDWGQEGFLRFSQFCIEQYKLYAPALQNELAIISFHVWMNQHEFNTSNAAKDLRKSNMKLNRQWKKKYRKNTRHLNQAYEQIWKDDRQERKRARKSSHPHLMIEE